MELFLAFDIETVPLPWDSFSESQKEYILRRAETEEEIDRKKGELGLSPITAKIVCIGMQMMERHEDGSFKLRQKSCFSVDEKLEDGVRVEKKLRTGDSCFLSNEVKMLTDFWGVLKKYHPLHLVSFNGRNFDAPFLMLRSALLGIRPSRDLMKGTKFNYELHTDLIDELTYYNPSAYGATRRFNFDFYTRAFGIKSPKSEGIDGSLVPEFFKEGKILDISEYCLRDVTATWELYAKWLQYLKF